MSNKLMITLKVLCTFVVFSIFYFSWIPDPDFKNLVFFPKFLAVWTSSHGNIRAAIPFFGLGFLLSIRKNQTILFYALLFFMIVLISELGQLFIEKRHFSVLDIFSGTVGGLIGLYLASGCKFLIQQWAIHFKKWQINPKNNE